MRKTFILILAFAVTIGAAYAQTPAERLEQGIQKQDVPACDNRDLAGLCRIQAGQARYTNHRNDCDNAGADKQSRLGVCGLNGSVRHISGSSCCQAVAAPCSLGSSCSFG